MTQRPDLFQLDRNHPLAKGLVFAGLGFGPGSGAMFDASLHKNHGTLYNMTPSTDWVFVPELGRWGLDFAGHTTGYVRINRLLVPQNAITLASWSYVTDNTQEFYGRVPVVDLTVTVGGNLTFTLGNLTTATALGGGTLADNTLVHVAGTYDGATQSIYINGSLIASRSNSGTIGVPNDLMNYVGSSGWRRWAYGKHADGLMFDRALTPNEIADLADPSNVYLSGLIAGRPRRRYVFLGGGSTVEINATLAALDVTGNAAGVSVGTRIGASAGAVELSGLAAAVSSGTDIAATTAACEATGLNATVSVGTDIASGVGNLDATAQAADVSVGTTFTAGAGTIEASGLAATVSTGDSIEATTATVELSGLAGSVSAGTTFTGGTGAVSLSGLAADVSVGTTITGSLATLVAAALAADVSATVSIEASTAAMGWSSPSVSVSTGGRIKRPHLLHGGRLSHDWGIKTGGAL